MSALTPAVEAPDLPFCTTPDSNRSRSALRGQRDHRSRWALPEPELAACPA